MIQTQTKLRDNLTNMSAIMHCFWNDLKIHLAMSINYLFENSNLTDLQKQGIITLLPKHDKDLKNISNWRQISLLNVDYKISTKAIANIIKTVLPNLFTKNQTGFMKNRYIGENIRTIIEIIEQLNVTNQPGLIIFVDFEKKHLIASIMITYFLRVFLEKFNI